MDPLYRPEGVEARWQKAWEEEGLYAAEPAADRPSFVIAILLLIVGLLTLALIVFRRVF